MNKDFDHSKCSRWKIKFNKIDPGIKYPEILHEVRFYESLGFLLLSPLVGILVGSAIYISLFCGVPLAFLYWRSHHFGWFQFEIESPTIT